ncbi:MAG TPA: hydrogen peroxide-inducible genes activator [Polyangiales bacterium]|nr:hydrogen peroxide-inducible genes activator [Polyangiales bacterium]
MSLSALTVQQLRYLIALDRHRNFGDAAMSCHVSQPALSSQVKKVEELLGLRIFDRSRQPILPTERGSRVLVQARRALEQIDRIGLVASEHEDLSGPYRLGVIPTLASTLLPLFLPLFARKHPRVSLEIVEAKTEVMLRQLREGTLDSGLAVTPLNLPGIGEHVVCHEAFYVYLPPQHPLATRTRIRQADLLEEPVWLLGEGHCFRSQVLALCSADRKPKTLEGHVSFDVSSFETLVGMVDAGFGLTILPELFVRRLSGERQRAQVRPFIVPEPVREIGFLHAREHLRQAIGAELYRLLREAIPSPLRARDMSTLEVVHPLSS